MEIGITHVLNEINTPLEGTETKVFSVAWVRQNDGKGGERGSVKRVNRAMKHISKTEQHEGKKKASPRVKESKLLVLYDIDARHPVYVPISTLIKYNGQRIRH